MGSDIKKAREILEEALKNDNLDIVRILIRGALAEMTRDYNGRAPVQSKRMNDVIAADARQMKSHNPDMPLQEIAEALGVNIGRVSEALNGERDDDLEFNR